MLCFFQDVYGYSMFIWISWGSGEVDAVVAGLYMWEWGICLNFREGRIGPNLGCFGKLYHFDLKETYLI